MSKRYVLLKDLPDVKAGAILKQKNGSDFYYYCGFHDKGNEDSWYMKELVEDNPDWFEEITDTPPNPTNEEFIWTDELVWECLCTIPKETLVTYKEHIIKFKQSKEKAKVNDGVSHTYNLNKGEIVSVEVGGVKYLSPEKVLEKEKKAFEAARAKIFNFNSIGNFSRDKYPTFEDYKRNNP